MKPSTYFGHPHCQAFLFWAQSQLPLWQAWPWQENPTLPLLAPDSTIQPTCLKSCVAFSRYPMERRLQDCVKLNVGTSNSALEFSFGTNWLSLGIGMHAHSAFQVMKSLGQRSVPKPWKYVARNVWGSSPFGRRRRLSLFREISSITRGLNTRGLNGLSVYPVQLSCSFWMFLVSYLNIHGNSHQCSITFSVCPTSSCSDCRLSSALLDDTRCRKGLTHLVHIKEWLLLYLLIYYQQILEVRKLKVRCPGNVHTSRRRNTSQIVLALCPACFNRLNAAALKPGLSASGALTKLNHGSGSHFAIQTSMKGT